MEKMKSLAVILLFVIRVQTQDVTTDMTYSGDGEDLLPTTAYASLIDENGDIENATTLDPITVFSTIEKDTSTVLFLNELSSISITPEESTSTVITVDTSSTVQPTKDSTTTTEASTTVITTTESTTVTDLPTTITSTLKDTTTTYKSTTNPPTRTNTVTERTEAELEPTKAQQISTEKATYIPANGEKHCSPVDSNLVCEEEIFCYGEGIIDCTKEIGLETIGDLKDKASPAVFTTDTNYTQEDPKETNSSLTEMAVQMNATEDSVTSIQPDTRKVTTEMFSSSVTELTSEKPINVRKKREENIVSSSKLSFNAASMDSSRKACQLIGNLVCKPSPTKAKCRGKATCQVLSSTQETFEKSTSPKGVENWAIAVIAICAVAAALTVSLLVYLIFTSWKKLKVQPQNGVTTLTYVNSTIP